MTRSEWSRANNGPSEFLIAVCDKCGAEKQAGGYATAKGVCMPLPAGWSSQVHNRVRQHICEKHA